MHKTHKIKIHPEYYSAKAAGLKPFEYRKNDRMYQVGDTLILQEWSPANERYTGREIECKVMYMLPIEGSDYVIMADDYFKSQQEKKIKQLMDLIEHGPQR